MGKRKERRLAAKIGAGRRVKLDLLAEPSDLGGSSVNSEDGTEVDAKHDQELPNSPSSSGQPRENPLSLLGQYSDDELDDGSKEATTKSDDNFDKEAENCFGELAEEGEIVDAEDDSSQSQKVHSVDVDKHSTLASVPLVAEADCVRSNTVDFDEKDHEADMEIQDQAHATTNTKISDSMSSTWKLVLHEESKRYYYWNTATGETSWELPDSLAKEIALANTSETPETLAGDANAQVTFGVIADNLASTHAGELPDMKAVYESGALLNQTLEQSGVIGGFPEGFSSFGGIHCEALGDRDTVGGSYKGHDQSALIGEQGEVYLPSHLVKNGEALLEKLQLLQGSGVHSVDHGWLSKCMMEIEIRLSDISSLLPYGPSLVPFWMHSERQFNRLENAIDAEIGKQNDAVKKLHSSIEGEEGNLEVQGGASVDDNMKKQSLNNVFSAHDVVTSAMAPEAVHDEILNGGILNVEPSSIQDPIIHPPPAEEGGREVLDAATQCNVSLYSEPQLDSEDVDMDIDMEVEDQSPTRKRLDNTGGQAEPSMAQKSEYAIPPPPQEEWIPPPPPDEEIPPPPPDEPPESVYPHPPPSEPEPMPFIYGEHPNNTYSSVDYYGNTITETSGTSFYENVDGTQIAGFVPSAYYTAISNAQSTTVLNPADSSAYYVIQNGALPVVPVPATLGSSNIQAASSHTDYDPLSSEQIKASISSTLIVDPFAAEARADITPTQIIMSSVASIPVIVPTKESASVSYSAAATSVSTTSMSTVVSDASTVVSKVQKAPRMKKPKVSVASSFKSNKKVSGLVDKWKAAKEELQQEEEEERETPLEILEKKKRREIEEWRAQQIASGEAKENANFQPLGGDWRERVKRRRAQKEAVSGSTSDSIDNGTKQPDLNEISKDLPSGWQAYWDDSSKQVYYANSMTAETTWTRPTR